MATAVGEKCPPEVIVEDVDPRRFREKVLVGLDSTAVWRKIKSFIRLKFIKGQIIYYSVHKDIAFKSEGWVSPHTTSLVLLVYEL